MLLPPAADEHLPRAGERNFRAPFLPEFRRRFSRGETEFLNAIPFHLPAPAGCFFLANDARRIEHDGLRDKKENETNELRASRAKSKKKRKKKNGRDQLLRLTLRYVETRFGTVFHWIFNQESSKRLRNAKIITRLFLLIVDQRHFSGKFKYISQLDIEIRKLRIRRIWTCLLNENWKSLHYSVWNIKWEIQLIN